MQGVERYKVMLLLHDEMWEEEFLSVKEQIQKIWNSNVLDIQHIGSTSIRGIYAKPILDVAIVLESFANMDVEAMKQAGFDYCDSQKPGKDRYLFVLRDKEQLSLIHLHCYEPGNEDFRLCVGFRDYLNKYPEEAYIYSELKQELAKQFPDDRNAYTSGKCDFIQSIYAKLN